MKLFLYTMGLFIGAFYLTACQIDASIFRPEEQASLLPDTIVPTPTPTPVPTPTPTPPAGGANTSLLNIKTDGTQTVAVDQTLRTITVNEVPGGRLSSFSLFEDGAISTGLTCSQTPAVGSFFVSNNIINWDPGHQPTGSPAEAQFQCTTDGGTVDVVLKSTPSSVRVVSSGWGNTALGAQTSAARFSLSEDGKFLTWMSLGGTTSGLTQILGMDLTANVRSTISLNATAQLGVTPHGHPQTSANGRYVAFTSSSTNYVAGAGSSTMYQDQIFVKDRQTGTVVLASSSDGTGANQANATCWDPRISSDGNYVVFASTASNLIAGMPAGTLQVYRKNLSSGVIDLVSSTLGTVATRGNASSEKAHISADGRYVVFISQATNLVAGTTLKQIFRKDMTTNAVVLVSSTDGTAANRGTASSEYPEVSGDGRYVVFSTSSTNLVAGSTGTQIFRKDLNTGTIVLVSSSDGTVANRDSVGSSLPRMSADGNVVVFQSQTSNLISGTTATYAKVFAKNITANTLVLVSSPDGTGALAADQDSKFPEISGNGRYVGFLSTAKNLVAGTVSSYFSQIYIKDLQTGTLILANTQEPGAAALADNPVQKSRMSPDGRYVVFMSSAKNLLSGLTGVRNQVFLKDNQNGTLTLVSSSDGTTTNQGNQHSHDPDVSADGRYVVFASDATNIISGTTARQIFRKDMQTGTLALVSSTDGTLGNRGNSSSNSPRISANGRYVAFLTYATNLTAGAGNDAQIMVKDMDTQTLHLATSPDGVAEGNDYTDSPSISADGTYVVFRSWATNLKAGLNGSGQVFRKNIVTQAVDIVSSTDATVANQGNWDSDVPAMSSDGRYVVFVSWATSFLAGLNGNGQVWRKDLNTGVLTLVSSVDGTAASESTEDIWAPPAISSDGRYVAFTSVSGNLFPADTSTFSNVFRKDLNTGTITLVSSRSSAVASVFENKDESWTQISADGRYVIFESTDSSLVDGIFYFAQQVFMRDMSLP